MISIIERNKTIEEMYIKDGKTQQLIADLVGLDQSVISRIIDNMQTHNTDNSDTDQRRELNDEDIPVIARLLLGEETQEQVAEIVNLSRQRVSQILVNTNISNTKLELSRQRQVAPIC